MENLNVAKEDRFSQLLADTNPFANADGSFKFSADGDRGNAYDTNPNDMADDKPSLLRIGKANVWMQEAAERPDPQPLWLTLWHEGELCCLFADSNVGKSIYAVQIADTVARSMPTLYCDFELSDKQFQLRYSDEDGRMHTFPEKLWRAELAVDSMGPDMVNICDVLVGHLYELMEKSHYRALIVDNLTYLCADAESGDAAGLLMMKLMQLKKDFNLSILVLAHTPKRSLSRPITQNDLAGSKKLFNFFDSVFAIGRSAIDDNIRYVKQLKVRSGAFDYGADNVIVAEIVKEGNWLHFNTIGYAVEKDHLRESNQKETSARNSEVLAMYNSGRSMGQIASSMGISKTLVHRIINNPKTL